MLDVLAHAHQFARQAELRFDGSERRDGRGERICTEEVPGVEAREVLNGSEELISAYCGTDVLEIVRDGGVVSESIDDHFD